MKFVVFFIVSVVIGPIVISAFESYSSPVAAVNLTHWREHRRKKRFILFEHTGVVKLSAGLAMPVDLGEKKPWRQLTASVNIQYQFSLPNKPIYWWDKWNKRHLANGRTTLNTPEMLRAYKDEAQAFIYELAEKFMEQKGMNGRTCLLKAICENAQVHINQGIYAEILYRILQPQRNLNPDYTEAWHLGKRGVNCQAIYTKAKKCLLDNYLHVREDFMQQHFVKRTGM